MPNIKKDPPGKYRKFLLVGIIIWGSLFSIWLIIHAVLIYVEDIPIESLPYGFWEGLAGIIFIYGLFGIPLVLFISLFMKKAEKIIIQIAERKKKDSLDK